MDKTANSIYDGADPGAYDVVVYGGTPAGIMASLRARQYGGKVLLIEPHRFVGGMMANGLGWTDAGNPAALKGDTRAFFRKVRDRYSQTSAWDKQNSNDYFRIVPPSGANDIMLYFEPKVARSIFQDWLNQAGVKVLLGERLVRDAGGGPAGVVKQGNMIRRLTLESGLTIAGKVFIDASYEGDLMALAGVSYVVGRESNTAFGETLNGLEPDCSGSLTFKYPVDPYNIKGDPSSGLLAGIGSYPSSPAGSADSIIQAYTYRLCLTDLPTNRIAVAKPAGYNEQDYELLFRMYESNPDAPLAFSLQPMPNRKTDTNNTGPVSTDYVGHNSLYPEASYAERDQIMGEHRNYVQGLVWTLQNHPRIPVAIRELAKQWGLCMDEFPETNGWPDQIYVREARHMRGQAVMTENQALGRVLVPDPIADVCYSLDSHTVQRCLGPSGQLINEGAYYIPLPQAFSISYGSVVPMKSQCANLLVPVCLSSTHVAFSSIRMEPQLMGIGESVGVAAALSIEMGVAVQDLPYLSLRKALNSQGL